MASPTWHELEEGRVYAMTRGDALDGKFYEEGDRVEIVSKVVREPIRCRNLRTGDYFYTAGASSFREVGALEEQDFPGIPNEDADEYEREVAADENDVREE